MSEGMNEGRKNMRIADNQCKETNFSPRRKKGKRGDRNYLVNFELYNSALRIEIIHKTQGRKRMRG